MEENNAPVAGFEVFDSPEAMMASEQPQEETPQQESQPVQDYQEPTQEPQPEQQEEPQPQAEQENVQPEYSQEDIEQAVLNYASERLGMKISSFDELQRPQQAMDERIAKIAEFVETTGRGPEDWFRYQSLNPSEMDDLTAVRVGLAADYPNLSSDEINLLVKNSYKLDPEQHDANTVQMSQLRLKVDAQKSRQAISDLRDRYTSPKQSMDQEYESVIDDNWISTMSAEVDHMDGLEFDLGNDTSFKFGFTDDLKSQIKQANSQIEDFFDPFIDDDGNWDYDALSVHVAVSQNIDQIVKSAYQQGVGDGQRGLVNKAANVSASTPQQTGQEQNNPLSDQVRNIMRKQNGGLSFNL